MPSGDISSELEAPPSWPDADRYQYLPGVAANALLGEGGMAKVVRMRHLGLGREVAVKTPLRTDEESLRLFLHEPNVLARLEHPGIVPVYDAGRFPPGIPFYAMRLLEGSTLDVKLLGAKTLDQRLEYLPTVVDVIRATAYAQDKGVIHRDLKPGNIQVGAQREGLMLDLGLALVIGEPDPYAGRCVGTSTYCPPEALDGQYSKGTDVFSLGVTLYEVVTGLIFTNETTHVLPGSKGKVSQLKRARPKHPSRDPKAAEETVTWTPLEPLTAASGVPPELRAIIAKATAEWPQDRYPDAGALLADMERYRVGQRVGARSYGPVAWAWHGVVHHPGISVTVAAALVGVASVWGGYSAREAERDAAHLAEKDGLIAQVNHEKDTAQEMAEERGRAKAAADAARDIAEKEAEALRKSEATKDRLLYLTQTSLFDEISSLKKARAAEQVIASLKKQADDETLTPTTAEITSSEDKMNAFMAYQAGDNLKAEEQYEHCVAAVNDDASSPDASPGVIHRWSQCLSGIGDALEARGQLADAVERMSRADDRESAALAKAFKPELAVNDSYILSRKGAVQLEMGLIHESEVSFQRSMERVQPLLSSKSAELRDEANKRSAVAYLYLGDVSLARGEFAKANEWFEKAKAIDEVRLAANPNLSRVSTDVVEDLVGLARVALAQGKRADAHAAMERAESLIESSLKAEPTRVEWMLYAIKVEDIFGRACESGSSEAQQHFEKLDSWASKILAADPQDIAGLHARALAELRLGRTQARLDTLRELAQRSPEDRRTSLELLQWRVITGAPLASVDRHAEALLPTLSTEKPLAAALLVTWVLAHRRAGDPAGAQKAAARFESIAWKPAAVDLDPLLWTARSSPDLAKTLGELAKAPGYIEVSAIESWLAQ